MSLSRETVLFGIALLAFATWIEVSGLGGWPFAVAGLVVAAMGFLGSLFSTVLAGPDTGAAADDDAS
jgi:hypothetical protein